MRPRVFEVVRNCTGAAMLEFALVLPVLLLVVFGITQFGLVFFHYLMVTNGAEVGARQLSTSRFDSTPYTDTVAAIQNATTLGSNVTTILKVYNSQTSTWTTCISGGDAACQTALQNAYNDQPTNGPPPPVSVQVSFSCSFETLIEVPHFPIHLNICPISSTMEAPVQ
jgi:Flp pilus assembly protein TadG